MIAAGAGVAERVEWTGSVADDVLVKRYDQASVLVLPSAEEGFGLVYIEALARGRPVVAARAAATPEVLDGCPAAALVDPGDEHAVADAIVGAVSDPPPPAEAVAWAQEHYGFGSHRTRVAAAVDAWLRR
jgi:glycosyltransferase involved in cell wall biosynthesis